ncbi:cell division ATP-binding protein FtsE [Dysgonomonas sp. 511]|uniref:cell division ATP-binding protein FtsE n=1 Tax=Dysgonomonas sp. 511 TaxID=2302930 RepID=UPI0013D74A20|nr:ATP-binding cassette domain-containing protein [Dysgonomonas sp. 511]NDV78333.1 ATP-binding cassette domain-containing protein [Dysgonomonas sp. 511]
MSEGKETIVDYENVELSREGNTILSGVNITINQGEFIYLIGKVGSGKTTFLKSLYHEIPLTKGHGQIFDYHLENLDRKQTPHLRRKVGIVFQDFQLLTDRSVSGNLRFVLRATGWKNKDLMDMRVEEVLAQVGMQNKGYKMVYELSGGEQQRVVIARALLNSPKIILADEPTGNLDPETGNQIVELLHKISEEGTAVIMSTHNYALVQKYPGRIIKCEDEHIKDIKLSNHNKPKEQHENQETRYSE